jgi:hypothetical protein
VVTDNGGIQPSHPDDVRAPANPGPDPEDRSPAPEHRKGRAAQPVREAAVLVAAIIGTVAATLAVINPNVGLGLSSTALVLSGAVLIASLYLRQHSVLPRDQRIAVASAVAALLATAIGIAALAGVRLNVGQPADPSPSRTAPPPPVSTSPVTPDRSTASPTTLPSDESVYNEFELTVGLGLSYELDLPPGTDPSSAQALKWTRGVHDLYRTSSTAPIDQLQGIPSAADGSMYNGVQVEGSSATAARCRSVAPLGGGNVRVSTLQVGSKVCVRTHQGRGALLTVLEAPTPPGTVLRVRVTVST